MKSAMFGTAIAAVLLGFTAPLWAEETHHADGQTPAASPEARSEGNLKTMQENAKKMQEQLDRVAQAKSDEERRPLMAEYMRTSRENMRMGAAMMGGMMGPMPGGAMMGGEGKGEMCGPGMMGRHEQRMRQLELRVDKLQMTMQRMIKQRGSGDTGKP